MTATPEVSVLSPLRVSSDHRISLIKGGDLIVAGYASVEVVDKQGDKITKEALKDAFQKYMGDPKYRNVQLAHSNIQVGEVIPNYTDNEGRLWKSEVDDVGMFVVVELRNDIEKAKEVAAEIRKGALRGFSIGGQAFKRVRKSDPVNGDYQEISKLELHEVTICEKGINPEATFRILKEDKVKKMTEENSDVMTQMTDVLGRLEGRLDSMEKGLPWLDGKDDKKESNGDDDNGDDNGDDKKDKDDEKKSEYSDVITSEYLDWMETSLKSAGVDTNAARSHFDNVSKANAGSTPEEMESNKVQRTGQTKNRESESGKPSTNALSAAGLSRGKGVKKSRGNFLSPDQVSASDVEAAYDVYKAAALEQEFKGALEGNFSARYAHERTDEVSKAEAQAFDARGPLHEIQKSIAALTERIENIGTPAQTGNDIQKSDESLPVFEVPSSEDLAEMSWSEVHNLANRAFRSD